MFKKSGGFSCAYRPCHSRGGQGISLFAFPKEEARCKIWVEACNREDLLQKDLKVLHKCHKLCEKHFEDKYISKSSGTRKTLFAKAIPTVFENIPKRSAAPDAEIFEQPIKIFAADQREYCGEGTSSQSTSTQTPTSLSSASPRKQKLRTQLKSARKKLYRRSKITPNENEYTLEDFHKMADKFLNKPFAQIVKAQGELRKRKPTSRRYSMEYKSFALTLYFSSPRAYKYLSKFLYLPSKRLLQRITERLGCNVGLHTEAIFKAIKVKVETMLNEDRHCLLCIDEMALKSNLFYHTGRDEIVGFPDNGNKKDTTCYAQNVLVIMARGLYSNWKQPIAYYFVKSTFNASELRTVLQECVQKLSQTGLEVEGIASDMGPNFIQLTNMLGVTPDNPQFELNGQKLFYFFDTCHLIKATRNNLLANIFCFNENKTSWSYVETFYNQDKKEFYRCAPKLSNSHIYPSNFEKMKVSLATQVLSQSVASGMNVFFRLGVLPREANPTIEVVQKFNDLFDILNSSDLTHPNKYKVVFENHDYQVKYFNDMIDFLKNLKIYNKKGQDISLKCKFINGWIITINSIKSLWEKLSKKCNFKYLKTTRVNTDCLENFFGSIRQQGGNCVNPTPIQFERAFKKIFCQNYLHSNTMNCKNDLDEILMSVTAQDMRREETAAKLYKGAISINEYDYRNDRNLLASNAFKYVCGYLIKKALNIHSCDVCLNFSKNSEEIEDSLLLTHLKAYKTDKSIYGGLRIPNILFMNWKKYLPQSFMSLLVQLKYPINISKK